MPLNAPTQIQPPNFVSGIGTKLIIEDGVTFTEFAVESIDFDWTVDTDDITHSEANGWATHIAGIKRSTFSMTFVYDLANKPLIAPYRLVPGNTIKAHLVLNGNPTPYDLTPTFSEDFGGPVLLSGFKFSAGPKATATRVSCTGMTSGAFNTPTV